MDKSLNVLIDELTTCDHNGAYGMYFNYSGNIFINKLATNNNVTAACRVNSSIVNISNWVCSEATEVAFESVNDDSIVYSNRHDATDNNHYIFYSGATVNTVADADRHTLSGIAWKTAVTSYRVAILREAIFPIARVACTASALVTVQAWVKKSHATNIAAKIFCLANELPGVTEQTATKANDTDYENLQIQFTPTSAGVVTIYISAWYVAANGNVWVDDMTISQA
jgi:hypothetical protein